MHSVKLKLSLLIWSVTVLLQTSAGAGPAPGQQHLGAVLGALQQQEPAHLRTAQAYQKMMGHQHTLSQGHLERSLVFSGANMRLKRVVDQLMNPNKQYLHIGVIGGSISWGHMVQKGKEDWFTLLEHWLTTTFPQHNMTFHNGCVPATQSSYVSSCLQQFVDADVDLVFVEYVTNDGYHHGSVDNSLVRSFERLLRKLLHFKHAPAVVLMDFLATDIKINKLPFYATGEDQYGVLAQYYSIPWLSYRDAVWHEYMAEAQGFKRLQIFPYEEERHPTPLGHRYMADVAIHLIQQAFLDGLLYPMNLTPRAALQQAAKVPPPMFAGNFESSNLICVVGEQLPHTVLRNNGWNWVNEGTAVKPKWGFVTWEVGATLVLKVDTRASAPGQPDDAEQGPRQQEQASSSSSSTAVGGSRQKQKKQPAPSITPPAAAAAAAPAGGAQGLTLAEPPEQVPDMIVWVGYVKSWRSMGTASFNCIQGCHCQGTTVDALHDLGNTQQHMVKLYTTQAAECLIEVKVNSWARTKEHKFKVTAIMVTHAVEYSGHGDFTDTVLLDSISPGHAEEKPQQGEQVG